MVLQSQQAIPSRDSRAPSKTPKPEGQTQALAAGSARSPKPTHPRVFARLQALFPPSLTSYTPSSPTTSPTANPYPAVPDPRFIKTRIITWNMHDSLPKGDLAELLGTVPLYTPKTITKQVDRMALPGLSLDDAHPYHLVVVGGQECPTLSGIPMGLAANFKHRDGKERDREKLKDLDDLEKDHDKDREFSKENLLQHTKSLLSKRLKHEQLLHSRSTSNDPALDVPLVHSPGTTSGWSAVLEDWFSNGMGSLRDLKPVVTTVAPDSSRLSKDLSTPDSDHRFPGTIDVDWKANFPVGADSPKAFSTSSARAKTGPYELLIKERLMGIYTAVYVHRDVRRLVRDFSTGTVPAGLIGGRLGNKGGVGISINFDGTTLLFINAHLAAHEDKVSLRVANLAKIKAELPVESFLSPDDPRVFSEDITDKFDHTYIFGDLNFRLDISRLHADWLISRKEYTQALAFDQLAKLIKDEDPTFAGLHEAVVNFPPTFKYDVMRSMKREKLKSRHSQKHSRGNSEHRDDKDDDPKAISNQEEDGDDGDRAENASFQSSAWTSSHSRHKTDVTEDEDSDDSPVNSPTNHGALLSPTSKLMSHAAFKAKAACTALFHGTRDRKQTTKKLLSHKRRPSSSMPMSSVELSHAKKASLSGSVESLNTPKMERAASAKSPFSSHKHGKLSDPDKGVYDSSSKQRVPSWCDRILWKTTIEPPKDDVVELEAETDTSRSRGRANRMGQMFLQAFRSRPRQDSIQIKAPDDALKPSPDSFASKARLSSSTLLPTAIGAPLTSSPGLYQSRSLEPMPSPAVHQDISSIKYDKRGRARSVSAVGNGDGKRRRRLSLPVPNLTPVSIAHPRRAETDQLLAIGSHDNSTLPPSPIIPSARVASKRWFLNLISRDTPSSSPTVFTVDPPPTPRHRKGEVVCLSYHTLDDGQMKRLEGRSDHRPVIGSYAIYV